MRKGIVVTAQPKVEELAVQAEELGFSSFWVYDTPLLHGDPFVALALCAKVTSRIKLGIGVTSPALRSLPATAGAFTSLNALAPGRIICGVGTGNTARRTLGMPPATVAELERFTAALQDLCAGGIAEYREGDRVRDIRLLHAGQHVNTTDPIEFLVAATGLKAAAVAGRRRTGIISFASLDPAAWHAREHARRQAGGAPGDADFYVMTSLHVLDEGEDPYGDSARDATGHIVMSFLAFAADTPAFAEGLCAEERDAVRSLLDRRGTTIAAPDRHIALYSNYLGRIAPADRDLILPSLIDTLALVGTRDNLLARIATLEQSRGQRDRHSAGDRSTDGDGRAREAVHLSRSPANSHPLFPTSGGEEPRRPPHPVVCVGVGTGALRVRVGIPVRGRRLVEVVAAPRAVPEWPGGGAVGWHASGARRGARSYGRRSAQCRRRLRTHPRRWGEGSFVLEDDVDPCMPKALAFVVGLG
ncbi:LLM class flavin-dependent oxidoreductase, partial [Nonomuraea aridisoli]|uniref:LLM class flavin-dependent oxidoreductase n=1 Tax=Nonomuraea aridisoli TaxID=2070368 RepID=UPI001C64543C